MDNVLLHKMPVEQLQQADGSATIVAAVSDLTMAN
ncbi:respiratory nitrate reductase 1 alpha chain [Salmonella enterica]|nr:respiratory nitrate reductase 1 alpha chain [Salmonella enterica]